MSAKMHFAVIGDPIAHSLSPAMQNAGLAALGLDADYVAIHVKADELPAFAEVARMELRGFNITVPHKGAIIPYLDEISDGARLAGSVNTVSVVNGRLLGDSTDGYGLESAISESFDLGVRGSSICFIGCGGAVQAVAFHFAANGADRLFFLNRTVQTAQDIAERIQRHFPSTRTFASSITDLSAAADFLGSSKIAIQGTSLGLKPDDPSPIPPELLPDGICLYETVYKRTRLLESAQGRGLRCANGLSMLLHQGAKSLSIWTERHAPVEAMRKALYEAFAAREAGRN